MISSVCFDTEHFASVSLYVSGSTLWFKVVVDVWFTVISISNLIDQWDQRDWRWVANRQTEGRKAKWPTNRGTKHQSITAKQSIIHHKCIVYSLEAESNGQIGETNGFDLALGSIDVPVLIGVLVDSDFRASARMLMYYIELCTSYDEAECISSRNGFLDGRCVWLGGKHLNLDEESSDSVEAQVTNKKRKAPQPKQSQRRAPRTSPSKRSHRGPRLSSKERIAAVLNFETVETVDERPFTFDNFDLRMTLALCALIVLMVLAAHRLIVRCRCRRRGHSEGDKTRDDDGDFTLLV